MLNKYFCFFLSLFFFCAGPLLAAQNEGKEASGSEIYRPERLAYIQPFKSRSSAALNLSLLEKILAECLTQRKSPRFAMENEEKADISIQVEIIEFTYSKRDISGQKKKRNLLVDAFAEKNTAALDAVFSVRSRKGLTLWKERLHTDYSQNNMTYEEAIAKTFKKTCRRFISQCFGKTSPLSN